MTSFIWVFFALVTCALLPIWEAMRFFKDFLGRFGREGRRGRVGEGGLIDCDES